MKKYLLFTFNSYYPCGGFKDYIGAFDSIEDAYNYWNNIPYFSRPDYCQIVDYVTLEIVKQANS